MNPDELLSLHVSTGKASAPGAKYRVGQELDEIRDKLGSAQRVFDDYRASRLIRQRDADLAWAKLVQEAALALPRPFDIAVEHAGKRPTDTELPIHMATPPAVPTRFAPGAHATEEPRAEGSARREEQARTAEAPASPVSSRAARALLPVVLLAVVASVSAVGLAQLKLRGVSGAERSAALSGTAFEATIVPANQFTIAAPASTVVERVLVAVGDRVVAGQALLVANDRDTRAAVDAAEIELRAADSRIADVRQRLAILQQIPAVDLARANGRVSTAQRESEQVPTRQWRDSPERAEAAHELARLRFDRAKKLADQGVVARQELEDAEISLRVATNDLENARRAAQAVAVLTDAQTEQSDLQWRLVRAEQAQRREAQRAELALAELRRDDAAMKLKAVTERLEGATIRASGAGVVTELLAHPGDQVYGGAPLIRIAVLDPLLAEVQVAPSLINALHAGASAAVTLPGLHREQVPGTIAQVNPIPDRNGNHTVRVRFENRAGLLLAGQPAEVRFELR